MPIMPHIVLSPDTPHWVRVVIAATMFAYAAAMLVGAISLWRRQ
jgi:hypothetical protein